MYYTHIQHRPTQPPILNYTTHALTGLMTTFSANMGHNVHGLLCYDYYPFSASLGNSNGIWPTTICSTYTKDSKTMPIKQIALFWQYSSPVAGLDAVLVKNTMNIYICKYNKRQFISGRRFTENQRQQAQSRLPIHTRRLNASDEFSCTSERYIGSITRCQ